jgi:hypothetical protein
MKRVTWADKVGGDLGAKTWPPINVVIKEGDPSAAKVKSMQLLEGLYKLRRVGGAGDQSPPSSPKEGAPTTEEEQHDDEEQQTLLNQTLSSLDDVEAELRVTESMLRELHEPVGELGGKRHATTIVSARTLAVVSRKAHICKAAESYLNAFMAVDATREALRDSVISGPTEIPEGYRGQKKSISSLVHRNSAGHKMNPVDADKAPFEVFAASFGLAPDHSSLVKLMTLATEATEWWAEETLAEALRGSDSYVLQRMINVCIGFLDISETGHPKLVEVRTILGDRLAETVFDIAQKLQVKDAEVVKRSEHAQPDHARQVADMIDDEIKQAVALGAPNKHPKLAAAKQIAVTLHIEEKNRWALKARQAANKKKTEDEAMVEKYGDKVLPVGPASAAGDAIEKEIQACIKKGAPEEHPHIHAAKSIMKWLRDQDGERKRMAAREKRLAEAAARKAEAESQ